MPDSVPDPSRLAGLTVVVTGANAPTGRLLLPRLAALGATPVALVRDATDLPGAARVVPDWPSSPAAAAELRAADAVVHLPGELFARRRGLEAANTGTARRVAEILRGGPRPRLVFIGYVGSDPASRNDFLRTKGEAEQALAAVSDLVSLRVSSLLDTPAAPGPFEQALIVGRGRQARVLGDGRQRLRPVLRTDAVEAVLAALAGGPSGVHDLGGPDLMTADELVRLLNRDPQVRIAHTPPALARLLSRVLPDLPPAFVDLFLAHDNAGADPAPTARAFGLRLTPLREVWG